MFKRAFISQLAAKLRRCLFVLLNPFGVPFGAVVYSVINIKLGEHIVALCQFIHKLLSNRYKLITNVRSSLMAVNIHRSEERFSRNAETDLVCRLLLEKKKQYVTPYRSA